MSVGSDTVTPVSAPGGGLLERFFKFKTNGPRCAATRSPSHDLHGHVVHHLREPFDPELAASRAWHIRACRSPPCSPRPASWPPP